MRRRSSARILAPLALFAALLAVYLVIQGSKNEPASQATTQETTTTSATKAKPKKKAKPKPKTTKVQAGDTLGAIAERTGVSVAQLQELNPNLDPAALTVGETVKLQP